MIYLPVCLVREVGLAVMDRYRLVAAVVWEAEGLAGVVEEGTEER